MSEALNPILNEPFGVGRDAARLLFDFAVMLSAFGAQENNRVLDFGCGTGWISEFLCRSGFDVTGVDIDANAREVFSQRLQADRRLTPTRFRFLHGDGHRLPFNDSTFGHVVCFDSLHHMADYRKVVAEMFRVLDQHGRAVFVEPGAKHSSSKETREFVEKYKKDDPTWLEKDVILDEILALAKEVGFQDAKTLPHLLPNMKSYGLEEWIRFAKDRKVGGGLGIDYLRHLADLNYNGRVIFYLQK
jgi:ubiquinone/menaquinone biosynthesis C-methylase UbiE